MDYRPGLQRVRESRWISLLLLAVTYHLVASAAHLGFMSKWALRDGEPFFGFEVVIEGEVKVISTASRPAKLKAGTYKDQTVTLTA